MQLLFGPVLLRTMRIFICLTMLARRGMIPRRKSDLSCFLNQSNIKEVNISTRLFLSRSDKYFWVHVTPSHQFKFGMQAQRSWEYIPDISRSFHSNVLLLVGTNLSKEFLALVLTPPIEFSEAPTISLSSLSSSFYIFLHFILSPRTCSNLVSKHKRSPLFGIVSTN